MCLAEEDRGFGRKMAFRECVFILINVFLGENCAFRMGFGGECMRGGVGGEGDMDGGGWVGGFEVETRLFVEVGEFGGGHG